MKKNLFLFLLWSLPIASFAQSITYSGQIASILYNNCTSCHHQGALAPFSLESYSDAFIERTAIAANTQAHIMPPWPPNDKYSTFIHQRSLTDSQINMIQTWVNNGAPEGDPKQEPAVPYFSNAPVLGTPNLVTTIPTYTVTTTSDDYRCFAFSSGLTADKFITGIEPLPGNHKIVHHILIYMDTTGACQQLDDADPKPGYASFGGIGSDNAKLLGAWVPGAGPLQLPKGMGIKVYKNGTYVLQIHYAPLSNGQSDNTSINFIYSKDNTTNLREVTLSPILNHDYDMVNGPLVIPANTKKWFQEKFVIPGDFSLLNVAPHMHLIGQIMRVYAVKPNKDTVHIISIDNWDFHWQGQYMFPHPMHFTQGTTLYADAYYDNTDDNPHNPSSPPKMVTVGESTLNEMMLCFFGFLPYKAGDENLDLNALTEVSGVDPGSMDNGLTMNLFPNPAAGYSNLMFDLSVAQNIAIDIYNMNGQLVKPIMQQRMNEGYHELLIDLTGLAAGEYYCHVQTEQGITNKKIVIAK